VAVVAAGILGSRWRGIEGSHRSLLVMLVTALVAGLAISASAVRRGAADPSPPRSRGPVRTWVVRAVGVIASVAVVATLLYLRPLPASDRALDAMERTAAVRVLESGTRVVLVPTGDERETGVVFFPGALVDPRAYVPNLRPLAEAGHRVVIIKPPLNVSLLDRAGAGRAMDAHPGVERWVVAGHSLGGVAAASVAGGNDDRVAGLLLWASFPNSSLAEVADLEVSSVSGSRDGLSTPAEIDDSAADLPPGTTFVEVTGANHAQFGDYGSQRGDGTATISRAEAQAQIQAASLELVQRVERTG
jgi:dienelactone hydrolase